jgi:hypothetical protein
MQQQLKFSLYLGGFCAYRKGKCALVLAGVAC